MPRGARRSPFLPATVPLLQQPAQPVPVPLFSRQEGLAPAPEGTGSDLVGACPLIRLPPSPSFGGCLSPYSSEPSHLGLKNEGDGCPAPLNRL